MSLSNNLLNFTTNRNAILLGIAGVFVVFCGVYTKIKIFLLFLTVPIFFSYFTLGAGCGLFTSAIIFIALPFMVSFSACCDICLNSIVPAMLLGHLSLRNITQNRKKWWYPESFLLRDVTLLAIFSVIFLSATFYREDVIVEAYTNMLKVFANINGMENLYASLSLVVKSIIKFAVGIGIFIQMLLNMLCFKISAVLAKKFRKNLRPDFDFSTIRISTWMALLPLLSLAATFGFEKISYFCGGLFVVSSFAPIVSGFLLLHTITEKLQKNWILILFYCALFCMPIFMLLFIMFLGIIDSFYEIRPLIFKNKV